MFASGRDVFGMKATSWQHRAVVIASIAALMVTASLVTYFVTRSSASSTATTSQEGTTAFGGPSFLAQTVSTDMETTVTQSVEDTDTVSSFEAFLGAAVEVDESDAWLFDNYVSSFGKEYSTDDEYLYRRAVWMFNNDNAEVLNAASKNAKFGWTKYSDWTPEEFSVLNGFRMTEEEQTFADTIPEISEEAIYQLRSRAYLEAFLDFVENGGDMPEWTPLSSTAGRSVSDDDGWECEDTNNGATNSFSSGCTWYDEMVYDYGWSQYCSWFGTSDFDAEEMCCACGGGYSYTPAPTLVVTNEPTEMPVGINMNWVDSGMTLPVREQGDDCYSCWAFAATECLESAMLIANTTNAGTVLSEQEELSCNDMGYSCEDGGAVLQTWQWLMDETDGQVAEDDFPYTMTDEACSVDYEHEGLPDAIPTEIYKVGTWCGYGSGVCVDQYLEEETIAQFLNSTGVINVNVHADSAWKDYQSGIMDADDCGGGKGWEWASSVDNVDHAVILVGINSDAEVPYWIIQNSWGTDWGMDGFIYLTYGENTCGLANLAAMVVVVEE